MKGPGSNWIGARGTQNGKYILSIHVNCMQSVSENLLKTQVHWILQETLPDFVRKYILMLFCAVKNNLPLKS